MLVIQIKPKDVNNYYRLSLLSDKSLAKHLMEKALSNVIVRKSNYEPIENRLMFENYFNEFISGTHIRNEQFEMLYEYYQTL